MEVERYLRDPNTLVSVIVLVMVERQCPVCDRAPQLRVYDTLLQEHFLQSTAAGESVVLITHN